jgi:hypothetical protein
MCAFVPMGWYVSECAPGAAGGCTGAACSTVCLVTVSDGGACRSSMFLNAAFQDRVREVIAGHSAQVRQHAKHPLATPLAWMHLSMVRHFPAAITPAILAQLLHLFSTIASTAASIRERQCLASPLNSSIHLPLTPSQSPLAFFILHLFPSNSYLASPRTQPITPPTGFKSPVFHSTSLSLQL